MNRGRYDECCPHCEAELDGQIYDHWVHSADYGTDFEMECSNCKKTIFVYVEAVPEFELCATKE